MFFCPVSHSLTLSLSAHVPTPVPQSLSCPQYSCACSPGARLPAVCAAQYEGKTCPACNSGNARRSGRYFKIVSPKNIDSVLNYSDISSSASKIASISSKDLTPTRSSSPPARSMPAGWSTARSSGHCCAATSTRIKTG